MTTGSVRNSAKTGRELSSKSFVFIKKSIPLSGTLSYVMHYDEGHRRLQQNMGRILLGIILGVVLVPIAVLGWFRYGRVPVAVADPPLPQERLITSVPLNARIDRELVKTPPIQADGPNLLAGAEVYRAQCATCHGYHGRASSFGPHMFPDAPALWEKHHNGEVVGVS